MNGGEVDEEFKKYFTCSMFTHFIHDKYGHGRNRGRIYSKDYS